MAQHSTEAYSMTPLYLVNDNDQYIPLSWKVVQLHLGSLKKIVCIWIWDFKLIPFVIIICICNRFFWNTVWSYVIHPFNAYLSIFLNYIHRFAKPLPESSFEYFHHPKKETPYPVVISKYPQVPQALGNFA